MRTTRYIFFRKLLLAFILFIFWVILTASLARASLLLGAICSALTAAISLLVLARTLDPDITLPVLARFPVFAVRLIWEIIKANIDVAKIIINPKLPIDPRVTEYRTFLKGDLPKTVFADSITLTPGTVTLEIKDDIFYVHCLAAHHEEGLHQGTLERMVAWLFGVKGDG
jgi:multicomponent Na+:H+ antiporter subunit E